MDHKEYKRIISGSKRAFLFVHGIIGTPDHFDFLMSYLPENVSVWNLLLDGHGKGVAEFSRASMEKWRGQVKGAVDDLAKGHDEIYVVAHSMGTLLTMEQAICNEKIVKMFYLQSPLRLSIRPRMLKTAMDVYFNKVKEKDVDIVAAKRCCGIVHSRNIFLYIGWIPRYFELFAKMSETRKNLKRLKTPCVACQSRRDEMVSNRSAKLLKNNPCITVYELHGSGHFYYADDDLVLILREFKKFIV